MEKTIERSLEEVDKSLTSIAKILKSQSVRITYIEKLITKLEGRILECLHISAI
jgi:hypothetical protein